MMSVTFKGHSQTPDSSAYSWVCLMARLCLAAVFLYSGSTKLIHWQAAISEFEGLSLPLPAVAVALTVAVQLLGGLAVALGWRVRLAALALAIFTVIATLIGHPFWNFEGPELQHQLTTMLEHLAIVGGFLLLAANGPGHLSAGRGE
ncbi:hypothetical protein AUP42_08830 [Thalassospira lucentensis]|uniref:DoxX family protein n=1 Tax=Thalassospira lucentensis TaxID=168935 RepID=A0A154LC92_9PROT|nr:DoxX family protein [Thalassospira lucentensis]KZB69000.1 hypothetical protein AUP42_08830 [Thalassospira lucentensis]